MRKYTLRKFLGGILGSFLAIVAKFTAKALKLLLNPWLLVIVLVTLAGLAFFQYSNTPHVTVIPLSTMDAPPPLAVPTDCHTIVVDLRDDITPDQLTALQGRINEPMEFSKYAYTSPQIREMPSLDCAKDLALLSTESEVEAAEPLMLYKTEGIFGNTFPDDPMYEKQWNMTVINAPYAWAHSTAGKGVLVGVLDTGITPNEDLDPGRLREGHSMVDDRPDYDFFGHGTHVAGSIAQWTNNGKGVTGVAYNADLISVKVLTDEGWGTNEGIAQGIDWATDNGVQVINMSLGGPQSSKLMATAVARAIEHHVVVVAAAGNESSRHVGYPAGYDGVICVSSFGMTGELAYYSNYGPRIDIGAPGGDTKLGESGGILQATCPKGKCGYKYFQGTSMASPHVAGAVAVLLEAGMDPDKALSVLSTSETHDDDFGWGKLDLEASLKKVQHGGCISNLGCSL